MGQFRKHIGCTACGSSDANALYKDGSTYCFGCGVSTWPEGQAVAPDYVWDSNANAQCKDKLSVEDVLEFPIIGAADRGIKQAYMQMYGIRVDLDMQRGIARRYFFPYYTEGQLVAWKEKVVNPDGKDNYHTIGDFKGCDLFGQQNHKSAAKYLILTEGEFDAPAAYQMIKEGRGKNYMVESIPTGATINKETGKGIVDKSIRSKLDWICSFNTVALCFDNDRAGRALAIALAELVGGECIIKFITFEPKDANSMLLKGKGEQFIQEMYNAREYVPEAIVDMADVSLERLMAPVKRGYSLPYPVLDDQVHGLRMGDGGGEITAIIGAPGLGKTTMCREIMYHMRKVHDLTLGNIWLEEKMEKAIQSYIAIDNNVPLADLRENPSLIPLEAYRHSKETLGAPGKSIFLNHFGSLATRKLMEKFNYLAKAKGCGAIALDNLSLVVAGQDEGKGGERKDIDMLMSELAAFVTMTGVSVIIVVHLKRSNRRMGKEPNPETDPFNRGGMVSLDDMRGSGGLEQMCFNIWALEGDQYGQVQGLRWLRNLKSRERGVIGKADDLMYNAATGRLLPYTEVF